MWEESEMSAIPSSFHWMGAHLVWERADDSWLLNFQLSVYKKSLTGITDKINIFVFASTQSVDHFKKTDIVTFL